MFIVYAFRVTPGQLDGSPITLKFVKFQNVQNLQLFFKDNQAGEEVTQIDYLGIVGTPIGTTNMNEFKRVAGKKGEGHWKSEIEHMKYWYDLPNWMLLNLEHVETHFDWANIYLYLLKLFNILD